MKFALKQWQLQTYNLTELYGTVVATQNVNRTTTYTQNKTD